MYEKIIDFRLNLRVDHAIDQAIDNARRLTRKSKTAFIRDCVVKELLENGFLRGFPTSKTMENSR